MNHADRPASSHTPSPSSSGCRRVHTRLARQVALAVTITSALSSRATAGAARALARPGDPGATMPPIRPMGGSDVGLCRGKVVGYRCARTSSPAAVLVRPCPAAGRARMVPDHHGHGGRTVFWFTVRPGRYLIYRPAPGVDSGRRIASLRLRSDPAGPEEGAFVWAVPSKGSIP